MIHTAPGTERRRVDPQLQGQVCRVNSCRTTRAKGFPADLVRVGRRKLVQINGAGALGDLAVPPGNMLEALKGDLLGKYSIRINDKWRIVFRWTNAGPEEVEIVDYH